MKRKVYIAGKITGDADYKSKFDSAKKQLENDGCTVLSPADLPEGMHAADYVRICFAMIDTADVVMFLPDYLKSQGALLERSYCIYTNKEVWYLNSSTETDVKIEESKFEFYKNKCEVLEAKLKEIADMPNCNDCGKVKFCMLAPGIGEKVRINCPLWVKDSERGLSPRKVRRSFR